MHCTSCCQVGCAIHNSCGLWVDSLNFSWSNAEATGKKTFPVFYAFSHTAVKNILAFCSGYLHAFHTTIYIKNSYILDTERLLKAKA